MGDISNSSQQHIKVLYLAAHLTRAADDIREALAAILAALEAKEAFNQAEEAILGSTSTSYTCCLVLVGIMLVDGRLDLHSHLRLATGLRSVLGWLGGLHDGG